jgi:sugar lactone lactonase YvrE
MQWPGGSAPEGGNDSALGTDTGSSVSDTSEPRVVQGPDVQVVLDVGAALAEGPVWDDQRRELWWVDIIGHQVHCWSPDAGDRVVLDAGKAIGSVALTGDGRLVAAVDRDLVLVTPGGAASPLVSVGHVVDNGVLNDSGCDPDGNLWIGVSTEDEAEPVGCLRVVTPDLEVTTVLDGLTVPNGIDWSPDERLVYFADSPTGKVDVFTAGPKALGARATFATMGAGVMPDGLTVDREGGVWVALWDGWSVRRYLPDGSLDVIVELPVAKVTSCAFGGEDLQDLFITTASCDLTADERAAQPLAGAVFRVRTEVAGRPARWFALPASG